MDISDGKQKGTAAMTSALALQCAEGKIGNNMLVKLKQYVVNSVGSMKCASPLSSESMSPRQQTRAQQPADLDWDTARACVREAFVEGGGMRGVRELAWWCARCPSLLTPGAVHRLCIVMGAEVIDSEVMETIGEPVAWSGRASGLEVKVEAQSSSPAPKDGPKINTPTTANVSSRVGAANLASGARGPSSFSSSPPQPAAAVALDGARATPIGALNPCACARFQQGKGPACAGTLPYRLAHALLAWHARRLRLVPL